MKYNLLKKMINCQMAMIITIQEIVEGLGNGSVDKSACQANVMT